MGRNQQEGLSNGAEAATGNGESLIDRVRGWKVGEFALRLEKLPIGRRDDMAPSTLFSVVYGRIVSNHLGDDKPTGVEVAPFSYAEMRFAGTGTLDTDAKRDYYTIPKGILLTTGLVDGLDDERRLREFLDASPNSEGPVAWMTVDTHRALAIRQDLGFVGAQNYHDISPWIELTELAWEGLRRS